MPMLASAVLDVDLRAVESNYRLMSSLVDDATEVAAVVKSDAYGLGLPAVTRMLSAAGCRLFFVANIDEALVVRSLCPTASVVVFSMDLRAEQDAIHHARLLPVVNREDELCAILEDPDPAPYFLNVETGFSRFGLHADRLVELGAAGVFDHAPPRYLFTHLACSDEADNPMNEEQRQRFATAATLFPKTRRSLSASAGVWLGRSFHLDIVRVGSALFGLNNARLAPNPLVPVVRLRAPLVDVRDIPSREAIGYGATFRTQRTTTLGVVGIGYKHGLPWACANKLVARVGSFEAPVIGRIAMEYATIDLTDVPERARQRGATVDFLYDGFGIDQLAAVAGVNGQEILVRLGAACSRNHVGDLAGTGTVARMPRRRKLRLAPVAKVA